jgi:hypothetical protein
MLGVTGMAVPELLTKIGVSDLPNWVGANTYEYWTGKGELTWIMFAMMNWAEIRRWNDMKVPGSMNQAGIYLPNQATF